MACFTGAAEDLDLKSKEANTLVLAEGPVLGGGAFSRVSIVTEESTGREYALKRMRKSAVVACPDHVYCEQVRGLCRAASGGGSIGHYESDNQEISVQICSTWVWGRLVCCWE
jgi:hypothetical protein